MNVVFSQDARRGRLTTVLGKDVLVLLRMDGAEQLSQPFEWRVDALSTEPAIDLNRLLGTHATVAVDMQNGTRYFDGIVCEAKHQGHTENGIRYGLTLRPWLHLAGLRRTQRIFHNQTVVEIVEAVLSDYADLGDPHLEVRLSDTYPTLEYTVQYGESDATFVQRLLERFGITWIYAHRAGNHTLVLTDNADAFADVPGGSRPYFGVEKHHMGEEEHFRTWHGGSRVTTGAVRLTEYNFKTPHAAQEVSQEGTIAHDHSKVESFDWPGDYLQQGQGTGVVARRVEEETGGFARHHATGDVASLAAGTCVTLSGDDVPGASGQRFVCLQAVHEFRSQSYGSGESQNTDRAYDGTYVLMPDTEPLRPQRTTPRPIIHGPQTAVVVGDGEIDCDEYGRILVRFHWDLAGAYSMRCRVSQNWASKGWGGMVIPRIGMEVIVEHLEGDPDKPIVTGCVYNGANMPPYDLPAHKTKSVFRSDTHKGSGFNEFMFEDEKGEEKIYLHAEKDHEIHVENNRAKRVDRNQSESVGNNKSIEIGNNHHEVIGGNMTVMVGPNKLQTAVTSAFSKFTDRIGGLADKLGLPDIMNMGEGNLIIGVGKNKAETVMISSNEIVGAAKTVTVGGGYQLSVQGIRNESTLLGAYEEVGQNKVVVAGKRIEFSTGKSMIQLNEDGSILIEGVTVTVKGSSRIDLN